MDASSSLQQQQQRAAPHSSRTRDTPNHIRPSGKIRSEEHDLDNVQSLRPPSRKTIPTTTTKITQTPTRLLPDNNNKGNDTNSRKRIVIPEQPIQQEQEQNESTFSHDEENSIHMLDIATIATKKEKNNSDKQHHRRRRSNPNDKDKEKCIKEKERELRYFPTTDSIEPGAVAISVSSSRTPKDPKEEAYDEDKKTSRFHHRPTAIIDLENSDSDFRVASALSEYEQKVMQYDNVIATTATPRGGEQNSIDQVIPQQPTQEHYCHDEEQQNRKSITTGMLTSSQNFGRAVAVRPGDHERVRPRGTLTVLSSSPDRSSNMDVIEHLRMATGDNDPPSSLQQGERSARSSSESSLWFFNKCQTNTRTRRFKVLVVVGVTLVLVLLLAIIIPLTTGGGGSKSDDDDDNSNRQQNVMEVLSTVSDITLLERSGSAQNKALEWVVYDTTLSPLVEVGVGANTHERAMIQKLKVRYALAVFYFATGGSKTMSSTSSTTSSKNSNNGDDIFTVSMSPSSSWLSDLNWLNQDKGECQWEFIKCSNNGEIESIVITRDNGLEGYLPDELKVLAQSIRTLSVKENKLTGTLPTGLYDLSDLVSLDLQENKFSGVINPWISKFTTLENLILSYNSFTGSIPEELYDLTSLVQVDLFDNDMNGSIVSLFGQLSNLQHIKLGQNSFSGIVPVEMYKNSFPYLKSLDLRHNNLKGNITEVLSGLSPLQDLDFLSLNSNELTGNIPTEVGKMKKLEQLFLDGNKISSSIPSEIGLLENLNAFRFSSNDITGIIPNELCSLRESSLTELICDKHIVNCTSTSPSCCTKCV